MDEGQEPSPGPAPLPTAGIIHAPEDKAEGYQLHLLDEFQILPGRSPVAGAAGVVGGPDRGLLFPGPKNRTVHQKLNAGNAQDAAGVNQ